jgi:hypothetical protein
MFFQSYIFFDSFIFSFVLNFLGVFVLYMLEYTAININLMNIVSFTCESFTFQQILGV